MYHVIKKKRDNNLNLKFKTRPLSYIHIIQLFKRTNYEIKIRHR